jgi:sulfate/thiosulfate transport system substrate-binding protein
VVDRRGTRAAAEAYLRFLYTPEGQEIIARNFYRPRNPATAARYAGTFATTTLFTIDEKFGGWTQAQKRHFADSGVFDGMDTPWAMARKRAGGRGLYWHPMRTT